MDFSWAGGVLEASGAQAGVPAGPGGAGLTLNLVCGAGTRAVAWPCGVAGRELGVLAVTAGRGLTATMSCAGDDHPVGELLVTHMLALPPTGLTENLGPDGLPVGGVAAVGTVPLAAELPPTGCQEVGLAPGPTSLCPCTPWAFCGALGGLESVELAEVASGAWLEQTKTPGSAVAL